MDEKTKTVVGGLAKSTAGALAYVLGPITGVIFYVIEKDPFVRFHAAQSVVVFGILFVVQWLFGIVRIDSLVALISLLIFMLWLVLIYKAWMGEEWEVPVLGVYARKLLKKVK